VEIRAGRSGKGGIDTLVQVERDHFGEIKVLFLVHPEPKVRNAVIMPLNSNPIIVEYCWQL
jgi:hypothetical protein